MEQKDYLMREIEKVGLILRAIAGSLFHVKDNFAIEIQNPFEQAKELLLNEINLDLDMLLVFDKLAMKEYLSGFKGMYPANLELLAEIVYQLGVSGREDTNRNYLEKALQLFELCNDTDKTFSGQRENRIHEIQQLL